MPGFNGTGPAGAGPMTGWGRGYCNPSGRAFAPAYARSRSYAPSTGFGRGLRQARGFGPGLGLGWSRGYGQGFGRRRLYPASARRYGPVY
jgi:hypothetical protein